MDKMRNKLISVLLSLLLLFPAVAGMAANNDEVQNWIEIATDAYHQKDYETAVRYFQLAADQGNDTAQVNLGMLFMYGMGTEQSDEKALEYFRLAADQGNAAAQSNLGAMYANGNGVEQSYEKALEYYRLSADQGHPWGQYNLGHCYLDGQGVEPSREKAIEYFALAAEQGFEEAKLELEKLEAQGKVSDRRSFQLIMDNCIANLRPQGAVYAHSVATSKDNIEIGTRGILINEADGTVSLTSEVNSITYNLADSSNLDMLTGWICYNLCLFEASEQSQFRICRKDAFGNETDVSFGFEDYLKAYYSACGVEPSIGLTPRNDKWTHLYEGTVDMLIAWGMLYDNISNYSYIETTKYPEGITYLQSGGQYYLLVEDGEKAMVLVMVTDETTLALGFGILNALHAGYLLDDLTYYHMVEDEKNPNDVYAQELSLDVRVGILDAIMNAVSFEDGYLNIHLWDSEEPVAEETAATGTPELASAPETDPNGEIVLADTGDLYVKITSMETIADEFVMNLYIENRSDVKQMVWANHSIINGYSVDPSWATEITPGKKANESVRFRDLSEKGVTNEVNRIILGLYVYEVDHYEHAFLDRDFELYPIGRENISAVEREGKSTDIVVVDNDDVTVIVTGFSEDEFFGFTAQVYLVNKTDSEQSFSVTGVSVNGYMIDPFWACFVQPDTRCYSKIYWLDKLKKNGIDKPEEIEMTFEVHGAKDWNTTYSGTITLSP